MKRRRVLWLAALLASAPSCATMLGNDYEIVGDEDGGDGFTPPIDGGAGESGSAGRDAGGDARGCASNTVRCMQAEVQVCSATGWTTRATCATPALCDAIAGRCRDPVCDAGDIRCNDRDLEACSSGRDRFTLVSRCKSNAYCNASTVTCTPDPCIAGEYQCSGRDLQVCVARQGWSTTQTCATRALCDRAAGKCAMPGE